ncbi:MAG: sigma-70 family RNA polymerase sigma factor [Bacteroidales bacterium]|nr:sigma-70 family RNA polymerase sigma factor [Bacteroidales bacterium]NCA75691.1 sigma-70 family RNA polymerase sigma factor [Alphaproteobacteria bacterium]HNW73452.1 sigma-70 family RNA polymerase sigma factor [Bacteroidales bacterium]HPS49399.1 sigma-70 family RNA polymerase sigma factor [Bacteroidales bacterium]
MMDSDEDLVSGCLKKNASSELALYKRFSPKMYGICLRYAGNVMEADEILQVGFIRVFNNLHRFRFEGALEGWIKKIIVNAAISYLTTTHKLQKEVELKDFYMEATIQEDALSNLSEKDLLKIIQSIAPGHRTVFNLYFIEGYEHKEIAQMLGISINTSKTQLLRARHSIMRKIIKEDLLSH